MLGPIAGFFSFGAGVFTGAGEGAAAGAGADEGADGVAPAVAAFVFGLPFGMAAASASDPYCLITNLFASSEDLNTL